MTPADLLRALQSSFPLVPEPWQALAEQFRTSPQAILDGVLAHRTAGRIRRIGAVLDLPAFGYQQALVALASGGQPDYCGQIAARHPGVSHCYRRDHERYDVWLTLAVSPDSSLGLEQTAERLARLAGATGHLLLPTVRRFKLSVQFRPDGPVLEPPAQSAPVPQPLGEIGDITRQAARALQTDLPATANPFSLPAAEQDLTVEALLAEAQRLHAAGAMRRYGAVLAHQAMGVSANAMAVWALPPDVAESVGQRAAEHPAVSHCYLRPTGPDWPFNLYTMLHGRCEDDVCIAADHLADVLEHPPHRLLWTQAEYRKARVLLFDPAERLWETKNI